MSKQVLAGCRVLVVEDETMVALMIEETLREAGCKIIGPTGRLSTALELIRDDTPDAAVLDMSVRDGKTYPVADELLARGIPFVISTGYSDHSLPENLRLEPRLAKPFSPVELASAVQRLWADVSERVRAQS